jgi:myo-inositol-1(or 4)-monophosphatase
MQKMPLPIAEIYNALQVAQMAAHETGDYLLKKLGQAKIKSQKSSHDDLLDVDLEAERILLKTFHEKTPQFGILSEEAGHEGNHDHYWIIDPLDGSANFQHGNPFFAIAIALTINHSTVGSVIYLPTSNETFTAIQKRGAYLNGSPIKVSQITTLQGAITHAGDIMKEGNSDITSERLKDISKLLVQTRRVRMIGTAATDLAFVACGRADLLIHHAQTPWDIEAGKLLMLEAGGRVTVQQRPNGEKLSIYSNGFIHNEVENLFKAEE